MKTLFVHNNFPGQFVHLVRALLQDPSNQVAAIGTQTAREMSGVHLLRYSVPQSQTVSHPFARRFDVEARRAEQVLYACASLLAEGFVPDIIVAHPGWGETLPLKTVFPDAKLILYCEYFYRPTLQDSDFDPEFASFGLDGKVGMHAKNAATLLAVAEADACISPTQWQRSTFPQLLHPFIEVLHDGIDTDSAKPNGGAVFKLSSGRALTPRDEVITYVARNLEPLRGYHIFMRSLRRLLALRPNAEILILGGAGTSYGMSPPDDRTWQEIFLTETEKDLDLARVHFLGRVGREEYLSALQVSACHVYLTYPFVLSWSVLEALSAGCVVVASDTPPVREVISDGENGFLVPFFDSAQLAEKVNFVLTNRQAMLPLKRAAREGVVNQFDAKTRILPRWMRLIERLAASNHAAGDLARIN